MKNSILIVLILATSVVNKAQDKPWTEDAYPLHRAEKALTDVIVHDIFSPPVASRIYLYSNIAAYEILIQDYPQDYRSLFSQVINFPKIPKPKEKIISSLSSIYAFFLVGKKLVFSEASLEDSLNNVLQWYKSKPIDKSIFSASLQYGRQVSDTINKWIDLDQYKETRKLPRYRLIKEEGKWIPTPPAYMAAIEPYWNKIRPVTLTDGDQFRPLPAIRFSKDSNSIFYKQAHEVYEVGL